MEDHRMVPITLVLSVLLVTSLSPLYALPISFSFMEHFVSPCFAQYKPKGDVLCHGWAKNIFTLRVKGATLNLKCIYIKG